MPRISYTTSLILHALAILILFLWSVQPRTAPRRRATTISIYTPRLAHSIAGGGGLHEREPVRKGMLPSRSPRVFVPPMQAVIEQPKLTVAVTIDAPPEVPVNVAVFGDPNGLGALSAGSGEPSGFGGGKGRSVGDGTGDRRGDGVDGVFTAGHGVSAPVPLRAVEPEYSEMGRRARLSGSVLVYAEIGPDGKPRNLRVANGLGLGLDEKALEAVAKWLFKPGMKDGRPVTVRATFEVNFRLL